MKLLRNCFAVCTAFFVFFYSPLLCAQTSLYEQMRQKYPDEKAIYLKRSKKVVITLEKGQLQLTTHHYNGMLHLQEMSGVYSGESIPFSKFNEILDIKAFTQVPDKGRYNELKVEEFVTQNIMSSGIFFDDYKEKSFVFPGIVPGAKTVLEYSEKLLEPRILGAWYFNSYVPVEESEFTIVVPDGVKVNYKLFGMQGLQVEQWQKKKGKETTYGWKMKQVEKYTDEENTHRAAYYEPHIVPFIEEITLDGKPQRILGSVDDLYKWYYSMTKEAKMRDCPPLRSLVDTITQGLASPYEKTRAIFYWVQDNIKYIAFEDGLGGLIPRLPDKVYEKRYGDCKDMANMLTTMLNMAGVEAYLTWIGTRSIGYTYQEVPTPLVDNHMIAVARIDKKEYFLDATGSYHPVDFPTSMIQGKQALMAVDENKYEILTVPVIEAAHNTRLDSCYFSINGRLVSGKGTSLLRGFTKVDATQLLISKSDKDRTQAARSLLRKNSNKFFIDHLTYAHLQDKEKALRLDYDFRIEDYVKNIYNEIYINLHLERLYQNESIGQDKRKTDLENEYRFIDSFTAVLDIPQGYRVGYLPANASFNSELFGFNVSYEQKDHQIHMTRHVYVNCLVLEKKEFGNWNNMIKALNKAYRETVTLTK